MIMEILHQKKFVGNCFDAYFQLKIALCDAVA